MKRFVSRFHTNPNIKYLGPVLLRYSPDVEDSPQNVQGSTARKVDKRVFHLGQLVEQVCMDYGEKSTRAQGYKHHRPIGAGEH